MSDLMEIRVPDIGDFKDVPIIEILVKPGDVVRPEDPLLTLESDKATMEVPSPAAGTLRELKVRVGDKVGKGTLIALLETSSAATSPVPAAAAASINTWVSFESVPKASRVNPSPNSSNTLRPLDNMAGAK